MQRHLLGSIVPALIMSSVLIMPAARAEETATANDKSDMRLELFMTTLSRELSLSKEQSEELRPIFAEHLKNLEALRDKYQGQGRKEFRAMRKEAKGLREKTDARLSEVLSKEQMQKYGEMRDALRDQILERQRTREQIAK